MGSLLKDKDIGDTVDFKAIRDLIFVDKNRDIPDPFGPVKYDIPDLFVRSYLSVLPVIVQRVNAIEEHLEKGIGEGRAFIRTQERPDVGGAALQEMTQHLRQLGERLEKIEGRLNKG